jgi:hypothetical protein
MEPQRHTLPPPDDHAIVRELPSLSGGSDLKGIALSPEIISGATGAHVMNSALDI